MKGLNPILFLIILIGIFLVFVIFSGINTSIINIQNITNIFTSNTTILNNSLVVQNYINTTNLNVFNTTTTAILNTTEIFLGNAPPTNVGSNLTDLQDNLSQLSNNVSAINISMATQFSNTGWHKTATVVYNDTPGVTVGIGTQNAIEKLTVSGNIYASGFVNQSVMWLWNSIGSIKGDTTGFFGQKQILDNNAIAMTIKGHTGGDYDQIEAGAGGKVNLEAGDGGDNNLGGSAGDGGDIEISGGNTGNGDGVLEIGGNAYIHGGMGARDGNVIMGLDSFGTQIGFVGINTANPTTTLTLIGGLRQEGGNINMRPSTVFNISGATNSVTAMTFRNKTGFVGCVNIILDNQRII